MSNRSHHNCLEVGDVVTVSSKASATRYKIVTKEHDGFNCTIREVDATDDFRLGPNGKPYAVQPFDTSLLRLEPNAAKTAKAMNASGIFKPFTVRG